MKRKIYGRLLEWKEQDKTGSLISLRMNGEDIIIPSEEEQVEIRVMKRISTLYREDITKFARGYEGKVLALFDEMPPQLARAEKKYKLSEVEKGARFREYRNAFMRLTEAMIVNNCYNATEPTVGLAMSGEYTTRKCYMADTGLLVSHSFMEETFT